MLTNLSLLQLKSLTVINGKESKPNTFNWEMETYLQALLALHYLVP